MSDLTVVSVNVGREESLTIGKKASTSGIHKRPVDGPVAVGPLGIAEDCVIDTKHHGGLDQALYVYRQEDYAFWSEALGRTVGPGAFGENVTVAGLGEADLHIGDRLHLGELLIEVTSARIPCSTLAAHVGDTGFVKRFVAARRPGFYARVVTAGTVQRGDRGRLVPSTDPRVGVREVFDLWHDKERDLDRVRKALEAPLAVRARERFEEWLESAG